MQTVVEKSKMEGDRKRKATTCNLFEARGVNMRKTTPESVDALRNMLPDDSRLKGILPKQKRPFTMVETAFGPSPRGSILSYQLRKAPVTVAPPAPPCSAPKSSKKEQPATAVHQKKSSQPQGVKDEGRSKTPSTSDPGSFPQLPLAAHPSLTSEEPMKKSEKVITLAAAREVEESTRGQRTNAEWARYHRFSLTASNFKKVITSKQWPDSLLTSLFSAQNLDHIPAIKHGRLNEPRALQAYRDYKASHGTAVRVRDCGLALHTQFSFLGASPDGLIVDPSADPQHGLLELKCPHVPFRKSLTVEQACGMRDFCCELAEGNVHLKRNHAYFYQVQGQMAICCAAWCDFFVWIGDDTNCERIAADSDFWEVKMLRPLVNYYQNCAKPYLNALQQSAAIERNTVQNERTTYADMETLLPAEMCQSRIGGRNGSNACTVIASFFVQSVLLGEVDLDDGDSRCDAAMRAMLQGNEAYDQQHAVGLLPVDEVLQSSPGVMLSLSGELFVGPEALMSIAELLVAALARTQRSTGGIFVLTPISIALCYHNGNFIECDSHSHRHHGALIAVVPVRDFDAYFRHLLHVYYPGLDFTEGTLNRAHFSLLAL